MLKLQPITFLIILGALAGIYKAIIILSILAGTLSGHLPDKIDLA